MKKIIISLIVMIFLASFVIAPPMPAPVKGYLYIDGQPADGVSVQVKNDRTGETLTASDVPYLNVEGGVYFFDMQEFDLGYLDNDLIVVSYGTAIESFLVGNFPFTVDAINAGPEEDEDVEESVSGDGNTATVDLFYGDFYEIEVGNNKLSKLFDGEIKFDGENYDVEEIIYLKGQVQTSLDDDEFGLDPYLTIEEITYKYVFKDAIPIEDISEDETLTIEILGVEYEISNANDDEITYIKGVEYPLIEGDSVEIEGIPLTVSQIGEGYAYISYNGANEKIDEESVGEVGGIEVYVKEVMEDDDQPDRVTIRVGNDIEREIQNGDDYVVDDEIWEWVIDLDADPQVIGVMNQEPFEELDEDAVPIKSGEKISLPEDYVDIKFKVDTVDYYDLEIDEDDGYLRVEGEFSKDTEDYNEVYVNSVGIYDEDLELIDANEIQIGDSDIMLMVGSLKIGQLEVKNLLLDILYDGASFATKSDDFLDYFGIIFENPEDAVEDQKDFKVSVPEERPEVQIIIGDDLIVDDEECPSCVCEVCEVKECVCPTCEACPVCEEVVCPECEDDGSLVTIIITAIMTLVVTVGGGMQFYKNKYGKAVFLHRHKGIRGYHDANLKHRKAQYSHRRYKDNPLGCITDVKKIEDTGGL